MTAWSLQLPAFYIVALLLVVLSSAIAATAEATQSPTEIIAVDPDSGLNAITDELLRKVAAQEAKEYHTSHPDLDVTYVYNAAKNHRLTDRDRIETYVQAFIAAFNSNVKLPPPPITPPPRVQPAGNDDSKTDVGFVITILVVFGIFVYFLPSLIAYGKPNAVAIGALNLLLGWTLIGWVVALVWALTKPPSAQEPPSNPPAL